MLERRIMKQKSGQQPHLSNLRSASGTAVLQAILGFGSHVSAFGANRHKNDSCQELLRGWARVIAGLHSTHDLHILTPMWRAVTPQHRLIQLWLSLPSFLDFMAISTVIIGFEIIYNKKSNGKLIRSNQQLQSREKANLNLVMSHDH